MTQQAPGKWFREGISLIELTEMFPDEASAARWFERVRWPDGRHCPKCGSTETNDVPNAKPMPYWCKGCKGYFSVRTGTTMQDSRLPLRKWAFAIYLYVTNLKGVSSMKLHRDIKVTQKTAWFMLHRLREGWDASGLENFTGPAEVDETYFGGREANKHAKKKKRLGRCGVGKAVIAGAKDRATNRVSAKVVDATDARTLQRFVADHAAPSATVYTDEHSAYKGMPFKHSAVRHSAGEYVRLMVARQRHRIVLGDAQARAQGRLSQDQRQAPTALCQRVRRASQRQVCRYRRPNAGRLRKRGREAADVQGSGVVGFQTTDRPVSCRDPRHSEGCRPILHFKR